MRWALFALCLLVLAGVTGWALAALVFPLPPISRVRATLPTVTPAATEMFPTAQPGTPHTTWQRQRDRLCNGNDRDQCSGMFWPRDMMPHGIHGVGGYK